MAAEDYGTAATYLEQAYSLQPDNQKAISNAAVAAHLRNDSARAVELARKARSKKPNDSQATAVLLDELWEGGHVSQLEELVAAEEWIPLDRNCGVALAQIRARQSRFEVAIPLCRAIAEAEPEDLAVHLILSECLLRQAQADFGQSANHSGELYSLLDECEEEATQAFDLVKDTQLRARRHQALVTRAGARALRGSVTGAMRDLDQVISSDPAHPDANFTKGLLLLEADRPNEARLALEKVQNSERHEESLLPLATACLESGDAVAATSLLRGTLSLDSPEWGDIYQAVVLTRAETASDSDDSVGPALEAALAKTPDDSRLLTLASARSDYRGDPEGAESALLRALEHAGDPDRGAVLTRLAFLYQDLDRFAEAADRFAEVVGGMQSHPAAVSLLYCLANSQRLREALGWARTIREAHPEVPRQAIEVEAKILDYVGDVSAAVLCLDELCSRPDGTPADRVNLAAAQFRCGQHSAALETTHKIDTSRAVGRAFDAPETGSIEALAR